MCQHLQEMLASPPSDARPQRRQLAEVVEAANASLDAVEEMSSLGDHSGALELAELLLDEAVPALESSEATNEEATIADASTTDVF